jgi:hypothetical protein
MPMSNSIVSTGRIGDSDGAFGHAVAVGCIFSKSAKNA